jgi:hypothetical protein
MMLQSRKSTVRQQKKLFKARFIKETFGENYSIESGAKFLKTWTFRNDGSESWPKDTRFAYTNGDNLGFVEK